MLCLTFKIKQNINCRLFLIIILLCSSYGYSQSVTVTYSLGDIPTQYNYYDATCGAPTSLVAVIPPGNYVTGVDVSYDMRALNGAWQSEQRSQLYCQQTGNDEGGYIAGTGNYGGTVSYNRTGLTLANGFSLTGVLTFEMRAYRTWRGGGGCNAAYNRINNGSWEVTVHYASTPPPGAPPLAFILQNNQPANKVYGQPNFTTNTATTTQVGGDNCYHTAVDPTTGKVFISDLGNNRILRYPNIDALNNGEPAEAVLGQTNFTNNGAALAQNRFNNNVGIFIGPTGTLWVCEYLNHRVLRFDNASFKATGANADGVLGQTNFTTNTTGRTQSTFNRPIACFEEDDGTLWVCDQVNDRLLRFDNAALKPNGGNADGVLGQTNFTNGGGNTSQSEFEAPTGVSVTDNGRLYLSDQFSNRIIWWDNAKTLPNGANATGYIGQPNWTTPFAGISRSEFNNTRMVTVSPDNKFLAVSDANNNRIMIFVNPGSMVGEVDADFVFGQPDFISDAPNNGGVSASSIFNSRGIFLYQTTAYEYYLFVSDRSNHRTKLYVLFDIFYTTDIYTPIYDTMAATEIDGDVLTFTVVDSTNMGTINIDDPLTGAYTYTPGYSPVDYTDTLIYSVCDKDGCDTGVIFFNVLTVRRIWIKADSGIAGATVDKWANQSIFGDSVRAFTGEEPTKVNNVFNYNPAVSFNGTTNRMYRVDGVVSTTSDVHTSMFFVSSPNSQKNQRVFEEDVQGGVFGGTDLYGDGNAYFEAGTTFENGAPWGGTFGEPYIWSMEQSASSEILSRNAQQLASSAGGTERGISDTLRIGGDDAGNFYDGVLAELMNFQHTVGATFLPHEVNAVESYLAIKYGVTLDQTNDNDNDGTLGTDYTLSDSNYTVWEDADNVGYNNDIAGIGRDDRYGLYQKQSKSENNDAIVAMALDAFAATNPLNTGTFTKDTIAMLWANNNGSLATWNSNETPGGYHKMYRTDREWKIEENYGDVGTVVVQVNAADLPPAALQGNRLYVFIDEDQNGDFTDGNYRFARMTNNAGVWSANVNFNDGEVFTFMFIQFDMMRHGKTFINLGDKTYRWINR